jgi:hypothetical protein
MIVTPEEEGTEKEQVQNSICAEEAAFRKSSLAPFFSNEYATSFPSLSAF